MSGKLVLNMYGSSFRSRNRMELRKAWDGTHEANAARKQTPFRVVQNAGDVLGRVNYTCGGSNQLNNVGKRQTLSIQRGAVRSTCDNSNVEAANCNPKYVYDSSLYSKYRRQKAILKSYNDTSFGGANNGSQSVIRGVRR